MRGPKIVPALARKMFERAQADFLPFEHPMRAKARELCECARRRFDCYPPEITAGAWVDAFIRAYAAWRVYTGED